MSKRKKIFIILIILWMICVYMFSNQINTTSSQTSGRFIGFLADRLSVTKGMSEYERTQLIIKMQIPIRKVAHFTLYALGGMLVYSLVDEFKISKRKKILYSVLFCLFYAITDEIHQTFIPGRSGEIRDVLIDTSGSILGITILNIILKKIRKNKKI